MISFIHIKIIYEYIILTKVSKVKLDKYIRFTSSYLNSYFFDSISIIQISLFVMIVNDSISSTCIGDKFRLNVDRW